MLKSRVIDHFGTQVEVARILGITKAAVCQWGTLIPEAHAYRLAALTKGELPIEPSLYDKARRRRRR